MTKPFCVLLAACSFAAAPLAPALALDVGDIVFTLWDADNNETNGEGDDQLAFVALANIPGLHEVYFTDNAWQGAESGFSNNEGALLWAAPEGGVAAGTVVSFTTTNQVSASLGELSEPDGGFSLSASADTVWAYEGELGLPTLFLSAITTEGFGDTLDGTGLAAGATAIQLMSGEDHAQYIGPRSGEEDFADYLALVAADVENNWFQEDNVSGVDFQADVKPFVLGNGAGPGDFNIDGVVDAVDYAIWRNNLDGDESILNNNGDGADGVDIKDYDLWRANYGTVASPSASVTATPEPAATTLFLAGALSGIARSRQRGRTRRAGALAGTAAA